MKWMSMVKAGAALAAASALAFVFVLSRPLSWSALVAVTIFSGVAVLNGGAIPSAMSERFGRELAASAIGYAQIGGSCRRSWRPPPWAG
jgi:hypothetical protein